MSKHGNFHAVFAAIPWRGFLQLNVTGYKTWMHHYKSTSKCESTGWKHTSLPRNKKFKCAFCQQSELLWDFNGSILKHYQDLEQTVNSAQYCAMPEE
jgi:hypothetical protein